MRMMHATRKAIITRLQSLIRVFIGVNLAQRRQKQQQA